MKLFIFFMANFIFLLQNQLSYGNKNIEYLYLTYDAEDAIIRLDYTAALAFYKKAFETKQDKIFAEDIYNALKCAVLLKDSIIATKHLEQLAKTGIGSNFIKSHFYDFFKFNLPYFTIQCTISDSITIRRQEANKNVQSLLDSLTNEDQIYHSLWSKYSSTHQLDVNNLDNDTTFQLMSNADIKISKALYNIFINGNDLSEFQLGPFVGKGKFLWQPDYAIIILHNYQGTEKYADTLFTNILFQQIINGIIKPTYLANLSDANYSKIKPEYGNTAGFINFVGQQMYINKDVYGDTERNALINRNRQSIFLYNLDKQLIRKKFMDQNPNNFFIRSCFATRTDYANLEFEMEYK